MTLAITAALALVICAVQILKDAGTLRLLMAFRPVMYASALVLVDVLVAVGTAAGFQDLLHNPAISVGTGGGLTAVLGSRRLSKRNQTITDRNLPYLVIVPFLRDRLGEAVTNRRLNQVQRVVRDAFTNNVTVRRVYVHMKEQIQGNSPFVSDREIQRRLDQIEAVYQTTSTPSHRRISQRDKMFRLVDLMYQWGMVSMIKKTRTGKKLPS